MKNLMVWSLVGSAVVGGVTLTYTLTRPQPKLGGVSQASISVAPGALGATFVRTW